MTAERSQKIINTIFFSLAALVLLNPLIVVQSVIFGFILPKAVYFRILTELAVFILVIYFLNKGIRFPKEKITPIFWAVVAYISVYFLAGLFGFNFFKSFWGSMERSEGIITNLHFLGFFVFLILTAGKRVYWEWFFRIFFLVCIAVSVIAIGQSIGRLPVWGGSYDRVSATFGNPAFLASYSMFGIFLSAFYFFRYQEKKKQMLAILTFMFMAAALILSGTRAAFLGTSVGILVIFVAGLLMTKSKKKKAAIASALIILLLVFLGVVMIKDVYFKDASILQRLTTVDLEDANLMARLVGWQAAWSGFQERWLLGWGPENFDWVFNTHLSTDFFKYSSGIFDRPHNKVLEVLNDGGILLFSAYLYMYLAAAWCARKVFDKTLKFSIILAFLTGYLIQIFFVFDTISTHIAFYFFLAWLSFEYSKKKEEEGAGSAEVLAPETARKRRLGLSAAAAFFLSMSLVFAVYFFNARFLYSGYWATMAHREIKSEDSSRLGDLSKMDLSAFREKYEKALSGSGPYIEEMRIRVFEYFFNFFYGKNVGNISKQNYNELLSVATEMEKNIIKPRSRIYMQTSYYSAAGFYYAAAKVKPELITIAIDIMSGGHKLFPNRIEFLRELGKMHLFKSQFATDAENKKQDQDAAVSYFEKAITYEYNDPQSWWSLGVAKLESGRDREGFDDVIKAFSKGYSPSVQDLEFLIDLAIYKRNYTALLDLYQQALLKNPDDPQIYLAMAAAHINLGHKEKARELLLKMAEAKPGERKNVEEFIKKMGL